MSLPASVTSTPRAQRAVHGAPGGPRVCVCGWVGATLHSAPDRRGLFPALGRRGHAPSRLPAQRRERAHGPAAAGSRALEAIGAAEVGWSGSVGAAAQQPGSRRFRVPRLWVEPKGRTAWAPTADGVGALRSGGWLGGERWRPLPPMARLRLGVRWRFPHSRSFHRVFWALTGCQAALGAGALNWAIRVASRWGWGRGAETQ